MSGDHNKYHMRVEFPERYEEQNMKTIQLVDEQIDEIVQSELKLVYDILRENLHSRLLDEGFVYMDHDKNKDIAILRDLMRSVSMVLDYIGVQYGE
jgi:hypothetical protein